jgi:O-acetylserine/cysteine efflux transporter
MNSDRRPAIAALTAAGLLWGTTVPLSRLALEWLPPAWLAFARFGLAAAVLLVAARSRLRAACTPAVLAWGAVGYGGTVVVQNAGITRTSVSHAALLIGAAPVLVAIIAALWHHSVARPVAWAGFAVSLAGVGLVAGGEGGGATAGGDGLVLASLLLSATFTVAQVRLLRGRDPVAVTAVQFLAAALAVLPVAVTAEGVPAAPSGPGALLATVALATGGTLLPFTLFAYGQSRVSAEVAGAFLNLEPLIGAAAGVLLFGDPAGPQQILGGAAILAGIALSSLPLLATPFAAVSGHRRGPVHRRAAAGNRRSGGRRGGTDRDGGSVHRQRLRRHVATAGNGRCPVGRALATGRRDGRESSIKVRARPGCHPDPGQAPSSRMSVRRPSRTPVRRRRPRAPATRVRPGCPATRNPVNVAVIGTQPYECHVHRVATACDPSGEEACDHSALKGFGRPSTRSPRACWHAVTKRFQSASMHTRCQRRG